MTSSSRPSNHTVAVPGAKLYYELRGPADIAARRGGPLVVVVGAPMTSAEFAPLADALAAQHAVVTLDPRGHANSPVDDPSEDSTPEMRADDIAAILDALGAKSADVFGSSGGAVTGLALLARHPGRVRTLIAHEPPLLELLPDAEQQRANTEHIIDTFHTGGVHAAWLAFMRNAGFDVSAPDGGTRVQPPQPTDEELREATRFFDHELRPTTRYLPDVAALTAGPSRVVVGIGVESARLLTYRTSVALCELLGSAPAEFPGDHGGFLGAPVEFADAVRAVLV